jgi:hypothetical protein
MWRALRRGSALLRAALPPQPSATLRTDALRGIHTAGGRRLTEYASVRYAAPMLDCKPVPHLRALAAAAHVAARRHNALSQSAALARALFLASSLRERYACRHMCCSARS